MIVLLKPLLAFWHFLLHLVLFFLLKLLLLGLFR